MMSLLGAIKMLDDDRRVASRERNKMHARKTRQRKKEHMNQLENRVQSLKQRQMSLKLLIKEKNTANILLGMFSRPALKGSTGGFNGSNSNSNATGQNTSSMSASTPAQIDPKLDELLKRDTADIPDSSKIPDLPALILPGHHNKRRKLESGSACTNVKQEYPNDGIDYELLGKDRTSCTPEELDKIRKERNRMHAKRTRDRKRIFMEEMQKIIKQLETENEILEQHLSEITSDSSVCALSSSLTGVATPSLNSPAQEPCTPVTKPPAEMLGNGSVDSPQAQGEAITSVSTTLDATQEQATEIPKTVAISTDHTNNTARAAPLVSSAVSTVSMSPTPYQNRDNHSEEQSQEMTKRSLPCLPTHALPSSITTTNNATAIDCWVYIWTST